MADKTIPTPADLRNLLQYDPESGGFVWLARSASLFTAVRSEYRAKCWNTRYAGKPALTAKSNGYCEGKVFGVNVLAHRAAFAIVTGEWPQGQVDHINGVRSDNRFANLRVVSQTENLRNVKRSAKNTSGHTGVYSGKSANWYAQINVDRKSIHLGTFESFDLAVAARLDAERAFGFHALHGKK